MEEAPDSSSSSKRNRISSSDNNCYPYETKYNDHFETPCQAYRDVLPFLEWVASHQCLGKDSVYDLKLYDPYYCEGRILRILKNELGFRHVIHEKRDFYKDIANDNIPQFDVFITNPPYSDTHKKKCLDFCFHYSDHKCPSPFFFLLLMPAYTATKQYYREELLCSGNNKNNNKQVVYVAPLNEYKYDHPDNTGKDTTPFTSLWFCGIIGGDNPNNIASLQRAYQQNNRAIRTLPWLYTSLDDLERENIITSHNRPNPRQRRNKKRLRQRRQEQEAQEEDVPQRQQQSPQQQQQAAPSWQQQSAPTTANKSPKKRYSHNKAINNSTASSIIQQPNNDDQTTRSSSDGNANNNIHNKKEKTTKNSKYRDESGKRTKKRF